MIGDFVSKSTLQRGEGASTAGLVLAVAGGLGLAGHWLLWNGPVGPGFALWVLLLGAAAVAVVRWAGAPWVRATAGWSAVAVAAAAATTLRATPLLSLAMMLVLLASASMVLLRAAGFRLWTTRPFDHLLGGVMVPARAALGAVPLLSEVGRPEGSSRRRTAAVARGLVLALPLLLLFGALFASADAVFERQVERVAAFLSEELLVRLVLGLVLGWVAAGLLAGVRPTELPDAVERFNLPRVGLEETATVLGLLALLFLTFVALQLGYLFGGREIIEATSGLTVAEYARRGFFELVVVAGITLCVLMAGDAVSSARRVYRILAAVLVGCVLVLLASAAHRLALYTGSFGLTVDRIVAAAVMAWLGVTLVIFAATVLRRRPGRFASGALVAGIAAAFVLVAVDPGAMAARSNLDRAAAGVRPPDVDYLLEIGPDAVPVLVSRLDEIPPAERCRVARSLLDRWTGSETPGPGLDDWRSWNAARWEARQSVVEHQAELREAAAGCG